MKWVLRSPSLIALAFTSILPHASGDDWKTKVNDEGKRVQELKIEAPTMSEEDQYGYNMPDKYRCDACKAVMYQLNEAFKKRHPKSRRMKEWEYTEFFEDTCKEAFKGYGIKLVNGENALSGPGLKEPDALAPGMGMIQMGGENWEKRLSEICRTITTQESTEEDLYELYRKWGSLPESMCQNELRQCRYNAKSANSKPEKEKKKKKEKEPVKPEKKSEKKTQVAVDAKGTPSKTTDGPGVDLETFMRTLAVQDGLTPEEYIRKRPRAEWEKLVVAMAGRIFNRNSP